MTEPSGRIVARPMVARACGHEQEFQHYEVDKFRAQRLAKFQRTRCAACAARLVEEQKQAAQGRLSKGEALNQLPAGTHVSPGVPDPAAGRILGGHAVGRRDGGQAGGRRGGRASVRRRRSGTPVDRGIGGRPRGG
jgi:hypothetical protein